MVKMKNIFNEFVDKLKNIIPIDRNNLSNLIIKNNLFFPGHDCIRQKVINSSKYSGFIVINDIIFDDKVKEIYNKNYKNKLFLITNCEVESEKYQPFYWYLYSENEKVNYLYQIRNQNINPIKKVYLNFRLHSNMLNNPKKENINFYNIRYNCYNYFINDNYNCTFDIDFSPIGRNWLIRSSVDKYINYYTNICRHYFNICVIGNGIDTIRMWDTLYCGRIPVIIRYPEYEWFYKRLDELPILFLNCWDEFYIKSDSFLQKFNINNYNLDLLDLNYYIKKYNFKI